MKTCKIGLHQWCLVAIDSEFYTTLPDLDCQRQYHLIRFYQCKHCDKKKGDTDRKSHHGIKLAIELWKDQGILYNSSRLVTALECAYKYKPAQVLRFRQD